MHATYLKRYFYSNFKYNTKNKIEMARMKDYTFFKGEKKNV